MSFCQWMTVLATSGAMMCGGVANGDEAMEAANNPEYKALLYREATSTAKTPIGLRPGPQLFIDDYLIGKTAKVMRRVNCPVRDPRIANPIITGKEDRCVTPYMTISQDPKTKRFRIWYDTCPQDKNGKFVPNNTLVTMESEDGIHWIRPPRVLDPPTTPNAHARSVLDEGPDFADPATRYKSSWWVGGMWIATSPDGLVWKPLVPRIVLRHSHDINNIFRDTLRNRYVATAQAMVPGPTWKGTRRATMQSTSQDLIHWDKPWYILTPDDRSDLPETQFYAMHGHLIRGDLWIGLVKVLHDNFRATGTPDDAYGMGLTQLAWTRDGQTWVRDQTPFFEPDPQTGAWDHAHAWLDFQLPVGDEVYIYYGGYKNGHKMNPHEERQIGLVRIPRDRYVARVAGADGGTLLTPPVLLGGRRMTVNAKVAGGLRVQILDATGKAVPGFAFSDHEPISGDGVAIPVGWKNELGSLAGKPIQIEFQMQNAELYGFDLAE